MAKEHMRKEKPKKKKKHADEKEDRALFKKMMKTEKNSCKK
ncbi:MAG TPA: hypothetical protein VFE53_06465 [Mucilaginibacter sp.]|jgi:hypothetical protein|nr:hypothetical protein [Mucilaginibacter sp.]